MEDWIVEQQARLYALYAEVLGMQAENIYRAGMGETIAYQDEAFFEKAREMEYIANNMRR